LGLAAAGGVDRLFLPPLGDPAVVARKQHLRHGEAAELPRPGVLGAFDEAAGPGERILAGARLTIAATSPPLRT